MKFLYLALGIGMCGSFAFSATELGDPSYLGNVAHGLAGALRANAQLYVVDSEQPASDSECQLATWTFDYYAKVSKDEDASGIAKIRVRAVAARTKSGCGWNLSTEVSHGEAAPWGTLPIDDSLRTPSIHVAQTAGLATNYLGAPFELETVYITRPDIDNGPRLTYLLQGRVCGQQTYLVLNGDSGTVFDAPQKPSCPLP